MFDQKVADEMRQNIKKLDDVCEYLFEMYHGSRDSVYSGRFDIIKLSSAVNHLSYNLTKLREDYLRLKSEQSVDTK